jgi:hypothetical protein
MGKLELIIFALILIGVVIYGAYLLFEAISRRIERRREEQYLRYKTIETEG